MEETVGLCAHQIADRVRSGSVTRVDVVEQHLDAISKVNTEIGAIIAVREQDALSEAREADRAGTSAGILDGVPVSVKDEYDVAGLPTSHGNVNLTDQSATQDSPVVARLRGQGAIIVGKGNQPDFAMRWNTHSSRLGWTRNPRDLSASVGGSSGGDAAAVAAGMTAIGYGSDLAGSIRVPAAFCHIYGLRTTPGRVPFAPEYIKAVRTPAAEAMSAQGPLTRSVQDLRMAFEATAGESPNHPFSVPAQTSQLVPDRRHRVARIVDAAGAVVSPEVVRQVDLTCDALESAGYIVDDASFPGAERAPDLWGELLCTELRLCALPSLLEVMDPSCFDHIDLLSKMWPTATDTVTYISRWEEWTQIRRFLLQWMIDYQIIVSPIAGVSLPLPLDYDHWASTSTLQRLVGQMRNSLWPACLGLPALALPNGIQLVAAPHRDEHLFEPARIVEETLPACKPTDTAEVV